jgi:hypothetical protein
LVKVSDLFSGFIRDEWGKGIIKSLHKSGTDFYIDNYKGITLTSNVYKVYSKVLEEIVMNDANSIPIPASYNILTKSFIRTENKVGERIHLCFNPNSWSKNSVLC